VACNSRSTAVSDRQKAAKQVTLEIGGSPERDNFEYLETRKLTSLLGLDSLTAGYDSLQIRIWLGSSLYRMAMIQQIAMNVEARIALPTLLK
jgi:hypothetical protein